MDTRRQQLANDSVQFGGCECTGCHQHAGDLFLANPLDDLIGGSCPQLVEPVGLGLPGVAVHGRDRQTDLRVGVQQVIQPTRLSVRAEQQHGPAVLALLSSGVQPGSKRRASDHQECHHQRTADDGLGRCDFKVHDLCAKAGAGCSDDAGSENARHLDRSDVRHPSQVEILGGHDEQARGGDDHGDHHAGGARSTGNGNPLVEHECDSPRQKNRFGVNENENPPEPQRSRRPPIRRQRSWSDGGHRLHRISRHVITSKPAGLVQDAIAGRRMCHVSPSVRSTRR